MKAFETVLGLYQAILLKSSPTSSQGFILRFARCDESQTFGLSKSSPANYYLPHIL